MKTQIKLDWLAKLLLVIIVVAWGVALYYEDYRDETKPPRRDNSS